MECIEKINYFCIWTRKCMEYWKYNVKMGIEPRRKHSFLNLKWKTLLFMGNAYTHMTSKVKDKITKCETALSVIPSGLQ